MRLYRMFLEAHGWEPARLNAMTPKQLQGLAGGGGQQRTFGSIAEAAAAWRRENGDDRSDA